MTAESTGALPGRAQAEAGIKNPGKIVAARLLGVAGMIAEVSGCQGRAHRARRRPSGQDLHLAALWRPFGYPFQDGDGPRQFGGWLEVPA
jgi:hypothetical protein